MLLAQQSMADEVGLKSSLAAFIAASPAMQGAKAHFVGVNQWPDIQGSVRWKLPALRQLPKRVSLIAEQGKGKSLRRWYVTAEVKWMKKVICLKSDVSARTVLDQSMLTIETKDVAGLRGQTWQATKDVTGLKTLRNMRQGEIVTSSVVKRPPLIKRGDHVTILVEAAGIKIRAAGMAMKSGNKGDRMLVQNVRSKQTLHSIVKDAHTVLIHMGGI